MGEGRIVLDSAASLALRASAHSATDAFLQEVPMRKFGSLSLLALAVAAFSMACDDSSSGGDPDALVLPADAAIDAQVDAEARGPVADFEACVNNNDCNNVNSDCRPIPWIGNDKECIPRC